MNKEEIINQVCNCFKMNITLNELEKIIDDLQKKAELGEHYKHLYSEVKKQKDEIFKYIKSFEYYIPEDDKNELLRMLGEIE